MTTASRNRSEVSRAREVRSPTSKALLLGTLGFVFVLFVSLCACSSNERGSKSYIPALASVCIVDRSNIWIVSNKGELIHLDNGRVAEPKFTNDVVAVEFINKDVGWTLMRTGRLLKTRNGGMDWEEIATVPPISKGMRTFSYPLYMKFADRNIGWIAASTNILRTDDGGQTWKVSNFPTANIISGMTIVNRSELWAVAYTAKVFHTTDGGENWDVKQLSVSVPDESYPRSVAIDQTGRVWVGSLRSRSILDVSNDGGQTWSERELPVAGEIIQLSAIQFAPDGTGRAAFTLISKGDAPTRLVILDSEDNGETWKMPLDAKLPFRPSEISFVNAAEGYLIGASAIAFTSDAGVTWQTIFSINTGSKG
ncbi:MAG: hypothetical protein KF756_11005 [Acidobacteria bacterium]|nr:hypothetical protein [Acidobacteriota bacterium]